ERFYESELQKTVLQAPFAGQITRVDVKPGEAVSFSGIGVTKPAGVIAIMSEDPLQIEAYVPEADISKIKVGNSAAVTLDAYGSDVPFSATLASIDPAETVKDGIPTYKITLTFNDCDQRILPGMTANVDLRTAEQKAAIAIPQRAIGADETGQKTVRILTEDEQVEDRAVTTGLKSSDGKIEILEGVKENESVILFIQDETP
ncbi:MAG: efflux RND transporter periplasmic adaptor subunit, partial [Candidatus Peregrinibacteria bacterium]